MRTLAAPSLAHYPIDLAFAQIDMARARATGDPVQIATAEKRGEEVRKQIERIEECW